MPRPHRCQLTGCLVLAAKRAALAQPQHNPNTLWHCRHHPKQTPGLTPSQAPPGPTTLHVDHLHACGHTIKLHAVTRSNYMHCRCPTQPDSNISAHFGCAAAQNVTKKLPTKPHLWTHTTNQHIPCTSLKAGPAAAPPHTAGHTKLSAPCAHCPPTSTRFSVVQLGWLSAQRM
jgi:hypothetical protein